MKETLRITGMGCAACAARIEREVGSLPCIERVSVNLATEHMQVVIRDESFAEPDPQQKRKSALALVRQAVEKAGYGVADEAAESQLAATGKKKTMFKFLRKNS